MVLALTSPGSGDSSIVARAVDNDVSGPYLVGEGNGSGKHNVFICSPVSYLKTKNIKFN